MCQAYQGLVSRWVPRVVKPLSLRKLTLDRSQNVYLGTRLVYIDEVSLQLVPQNCMVYNSRWFWSTPFILLEIQIHSSTVYLSSPPGNGESNMMKFSPPCVGKLDTFTPEPNQFYLSCLPREGWGSSKVNSYPQQPSQCSNHHLHCLVVVHGDCPSFLF